MLHSDTVCLLSICICRVGTVHPPIRMEGENELLKHLFCFCSRTQKKRNPLAIIGTSRRTPKSGWRMICSCRLCVCPWETSSRMSSCSRLTKLIKLRTMIKNKSTFSFFVKIKHILRICLNCVCLL